MGAQVAGALGVVDNRAALGELFNRVADLLVEDAAIGDDDDGVEAGGAGSQRLIGEGAQGGS